MSKRIWLPAVILLGLTLTSLQSAAAEELSVKLLDIPILNFNTEGLPLSSNGKVDVSFYEPYSIEFGGSQAMQFSTCTQFVDTVKNLTATWTVAGKSQSREISTGNVMYTIGLTKTGIQCALSRRVRTWWDEPYTFAANEPSVPMTITISMNGSKLAEKTGILRNPDFTQSVPEIAGLSRGDAVKGYATFTFKGNVPSGPFLYTPQVSLCPVNSTGHDCGWGYIDSNGTGVIIANPLAYGKTATLQIIWTYTNSAGVDVSTKAQVIGLTIQQPTNPIPWSVLAPSAQFWSKSSYLFIVTNIYCAEDEVIKSNSTTCKGEPALFSIDTGGHVQDSGLIAEIKLEVKSRADGCAEQVAMPITVVTGKTKTITFTGIGNPKHFVRLKLSSALDFFDSDQFMDRNQAIYKVGVDVPEYTNYGKGSKCHEITPPALTKISQVPSGKVNKSSNAYKSMYTVGQNFAKVSTASDSARAQCTSALQSGLIRAGGIPRYLGTQTALIQSYLQTASGFQGCLDGFGR